MCEHVEDEEGLKEHVGDGIFPSYTKTLRLTEGSSTVDVQSF
jgi:hypothetical protein